MEQENKSTRSFSMDLTMSFIVYFVGGVFIHIVAFQKPHSIWEDLFAVSLVSALFISFSPKMRFNATTFLISLSNITGYVVGAAVAMSINK